MALYNWVWFGITSVYLVSPSPLLSFSLDPSGRVRAKLTLMLTFLSVWFVSQCASTRGSVSLFVLTFCLWLTFILLGVHSYTGNDHFLTAGGAVGCITGFAGFYLGIASFLSPYNSHFTLPVGPLGQNKR